MGLFDRFLRPPQPILRGASIEMRAPAPGDYEAWRDLRDASRSFLTPWEPSWTADELSRVAFTARLARYRADASERSGFTFFLFDRSTGELTGGITLGQIRRGVAQHGTLGYWMGERFSGAGRMREAVELICEFAFDVENLHRLEAACLPANHRSTALLERIGFRREGLLRQYLKIAGNFEDHLLYALLAPEWSERAASLRAASMSRA